MDNILCAVVCAVFFSSVCQAQTVKMEFSGPVHLPKARLWLPCSFDQCMIDTGGRGFPLLAPSSKIGNARLTGKKTITSLLGEKECDSVDLGNIHLAGKQFRPQESYVCAWFPEANSPMLGLSFFFDQKFSLKFSTEEFSWLTAIQNPTGELIDVDGWKALEISVGAIKQLAVIDTGAPFSLIDRGFYSQNSELFSSTDMPGVVKLNVPLQVVDESFKDVRFQIVDLKATFGATAPDVFMGLNHLQEKDWEFDFQNHKYKLVKPH